MAKNLLYYQRTTDINGKYLWKNNAEEQMLFIRDTICSRLLKTMAFVVSTHTSKSISLPVYWFVLNNGVKVICRNNFYDWKVSVELPVPFGLENIIPLDIISNKENISSCYCEGFKKNWVYETYQPNNLTQTKFTIEISDDYKFYLLMYVLSHSISDLNFSDEQKLTKEELTKVIDRIYKEQGVYDNTYLWGKNKDGIDVYKHQMAGWEIFWKTYKYLDDKKNILDMDVVDDPEKFADLIMEDPEAYKIFEKDIYKYLIVPN